MTTIEQMIQRGAKRLDATDTKHPTNKDRQNAWNAFLEKARSYLPPELRSHLFLSFGFFEDIEACLRII